MAYQLHQGLLGLEGFDPLRLTFGKHVDAPEGEGPRRERTGDVASALVQLRVESRQHLEIIPKRGHGRFRPEFELREAGGHRGTIRIKPHCRHVIGEYAVPPSVQGGGRGRFAPTWPSQKGDGPAVDSYRASVQYQSSPLMEQHAQGGPQDEEAEHPLLYTRGWLDDDLAPATHQESSHLFPEEVHFLGRCFRMYSCADGLRW